MKRDMDLVRRILMFARSNDMHHPIPISHQFPDVHTKSLVYHLKLIQDANLAHVEHTSIGGWHVGHLTWEGHEFLDATLNDTLWEQAKERFQAVGIEMGFGILTDYLRQQAMSILIE
jgi:hypothetical protein